MMGDLISRSAFVEALNKEEKECEDCMIMPSWHSALKILDEQPTVDAVPVVHGEWEGKGFNFRCSECGYHEYGQTIDCAKAWWNFCPNCGADMRKKVQE